MMDEFEDSLITLNSEKAVNLCKDLIDSKRVPVTEIFDSIGRALDVVGDKYEKGEYFLSELIMAGEVIKDVLGLIDPYYKKEEREMIATVVLATVRGDLHDIGKNIVAMLLQSSGFKVIDLGVDVPSDDIIKAVRDNKSDILGLSALLTTTVSEFGNIVTDLKQAGLREKVKIIIGGAAVNEELVQKYHVDGWGKTAIEGSKICKQWIGHEEST